MAVRPGGRVTFRATGFRPGSKVKVELHSDPIPLTTATAGGDGDVTADLTIPSSAPGGDHHVVATGVDDNGATLVRTVALILDVSPPAIDGLSVSPSSVSPGQKLTISARVTDELGVQYVGLVARWPGAGQAVPWCPEFATRTSGTAQDGVWTVNCTVPGVVNSGTYDVWPYASDLLGNYVNINGGPTIDTRATFTVTGGTSDTSPPQVLSLTASPSSVSPGQKLTISARVTDDLGVQYVGLVARWPGAGQAVPWCPEFATRTSGTAQDGVWTVTCTVPDVVNSGTYQVWPYASDTLGNYVNINGGPTIDLATTFTVAGGISDTSPPEILSLTVSPTSVSPGQELTISARVTDAVGVQYVGLVARWPGAGQAVPWCPEFATRTSGTAQDGVWTVTCTVPDVVNAGTYEVWPYASDTLGNYVNINGGPTIDTKASFTIG